MQRRVREHRPSIDVAFTHAAASAGPPHARRAYLADALAMLVLALLLAVAPTAGARGPRYTVTWTFPNGDGGADKVRQSVWPYAAGGPLTFMAPGQPVLDTTTKGGWYRADDGLRLTLIALGLPKRQPMTAPAPAAAAPAGVGAGAVDNQGRPAPG